MTKQSDVGFGQTVYSMSKSNVHNLQVNIQCQSTSNDGDTDNYSCQLKQVFIDNPPKPLTHAAADCICLAENERSSDFVLKKSSTNLGPRWVMHYIAYEMPRYGHDSANLVPTLGHNWTNQKHQNNANVGPILECLLGCYSGFLASYTFLKNSENVYFTSAPSRKC